MIKVIFLSEKYLQLGPKRYWNANYQKFGRNQNASFSNCLMTFGHKFVQLNQKMNWNANFQKRYWNVNYGEASLLIKCYLDTSPDRDWEGEKHKDVGEKGDYHRTATISLSNKRWLISNNIYLPEQKKVIIIERHPFPWWMKGDNNPSPTLWSWYHWTVL